MFGKAEQYRQACEAMIHAAPPALNLDGGTMYITTQGGVRYACGDHGFVFDAEQSLMLLRWMRATFEPPQDAPLRSSRRRPEPEVPELSEEHIENYMAHDRDFQKALIKCAYRAGAEEMNRRWREREGK